MVAKSTEASVAIVIVAFSNLWHSSRIFTKCILQTTERPHYSTLLLDPDMAQNTDKCLNPGARFCSAELLNSAYFLWHLQTPKPTYTETLKKKESLKIHLHFLFSSSWVSIRPSKSVTKALNVKTQFNTKKYWQINSFMLHTFSQSCFSKSKWVILWNEWLLHFNNLLYLKLNLYMWGQNHI